MYLSIQSPPEQLFTFITTSYKFHSGIAPLFLPIYNYNTITVFKFLQYPYCNFLKTVHPYIPPNKKRITYHHYQCNPL